MGGFLLRQVIAVAGISGLLHGCAINSVGTLAARVTHAHAAVVVDLYTLGAHLRTRAEDRGLTIGLGRRSYVFAAEGADKISAGWHLLCAPMPPIAALAQHVASLGLEARAGPAHYGVALVLRGGTVIAQIPRGTDIVLALDYTPADPGRTQLRLLLGI